MKQDLSNVPDETLILLLRAGNHFAFERIYHKYKGLLTTHAYKKLGVFEDAQEIVQEVFTKIWINHERTPELRNLVAWLYVLVRNQVLNHIEHAQVVQKYEASFKNFMFQDNYIADIILREKEMKKLIDREIEALPPKMKAVFLLSRNDHLSNKMVAEKLDISENTVKNHLKAALKILHSRLGSVFSIII